MTTTTNNDNTDDTVNTAVPSSNDTCTLDDWHSRWVNRRRMAWFSLVSMVSITLLLYFAVPVDKIDKLSDVTIWLYGTLATVIVAYMGTTVSAHIFDRRK